MSAPASHVQDDVRQSVRVLDASAGRRRATRIGILAIGWAVRHAVAIGGALVFAFPLLWMISTSLKDGPQVYRWPPVWIPNPILLSNYPKAWAELPFATFYVNTLIITAAAIVGTLLSSSLVAFGFARVRFVGRGVLFLVVLSTMMLPYQVTMIPIYIFFANLRWVNTFLPLIVPSFFGSAFNIFLLRQFFMTIPVELDDAARIDGASLFQIYWRIILPLSKAALGVIAIFAFTYNWNEFLTPLLYLQREQLFTISLGLMMFNTQTGTEFQSLMAMATVAILPQLVVFFLAQRYFVQGVVMTGIKG